MTENEKIAREIISLADDIEYAIQGNNVSAAFDYIADLRYVLWTLEDNLEDDDGQEEFAVS